MPTDDAYAFGPFRLQPAGRLLLRDGQPVRLGTRAFDMLHVLVAHAGETLANDELLARVWGATVVDDGSIRVHVAAIRKALGDDTTRQAYVANIPQRGYTFVAPVTRHATPEAPLGPPPAADPTVPALATPLVGREETVRTVVAQLAQRRLVTLVGPGGIGKTSVALDVANRLRGHYPQGICFVDLAPLADPTFVPSALAAALGVPVLGEDALSRVVAQLHGRTTLIVIDNCEQVVDAIAGLAESLLRRAPGVTLLATSREALRAQGEWIQRLGGLATPWGEQRCSAAEALAFPAIQLLVDRIRAADDTFHLTDTDVAPAVRICQTLDGIPLAIELAAAHVASFGLANLATLLSDRLNQLAQGRRTVLARHQTLGATLDWSHGLLDDHEQAVLRRLSVFRGPFSIEAAVAMGQCERIDAAAAADSLVGLVNKSMVALDAGGAGDDPAYRLLETTRGYAQQRLAASGELAAYARRHAQRVCATLQAVDTPHDEGPAHWRRRAPLRIDDVRAALDWALAAGADPALGVDLTVASAPLWFGLGLVKEFRDRLDQAEAARATLPPDPVRDLHLSLARGHAYLHTMGPSEASDTALRRALDNALLAGRAEDRLSALWSLYTERMVRGDYAATLALARQFGDEAEALGDPQARLTHHRMMAMSLHMSAEHAPALDHARRALDAPLGRAPYLHGTAYQVDHRASAMAPMARILWVQGRADEAAALVAEAVERATSLDLGFSSTYTLALAACPIALWRGDLARARQYTRTLQDCAARHTLEFWQTWGQMYEQVLAWWPTRDPVEPGWVPMFAQHAGRCDMLGTLAVDLLHPRALQRVDAGQNPWCAVELRRAGTERQWRQGRLPPDRVGELLAACVRDAAQQGALAWELRATTTFAEWLQTVDRQAEAADRLTAVLDRVTQGHDTQDPARARALLTRLAS